MSQMSNDSVYTADKVLGIIAAVLGGGCNCVIGAGLVGLGAFGGAIVQQTATDPSVSPQDAQNAAAAVSAFGAMGGLVGGLLILVAIGSIAGGIGMFKGLRWGFLITAILQGLAFILNLVSMNIFGVLICGALTVYCVLRLIGKVGPQPA